MIPAGAPLPTSTQPAVTWAKAVHYMYITIRRARVDDDTRRAVVRAPAMPVVLAVNSCLLGPGSAQHRRPAPPTHPAESVCKLRLPGIPLANTLEFVRGFLAPQTQLKVLVHSLECAELHRTPSSAPTMSRRWRWKLLEFLRVSDTAVQ